MVDFVDENVQTLAGNGTKGSDYKGGGSGITQVRIFRIFMNCIPCMMQHKHKVNMVQPVDSHRMPSNSRK